MRSPENSLHDTPEHEALAHVLQNWQSCAGHLEVLAVQCMGLCAYLPPAEAEVIRARLERTRVPDLATPNQDLFDLDLLHRRVEDFRAAWATRHQCMVNIHPEAEQCQ